MFVHKLGRAGRGFPRLQINCLKMSTMHRLSENLVLGKIFLFSAAQLVLLLVHLIQFTIAATESALINYRCSRRDDHKLQNFPFPREPKRTDRNMDLIKRKMRKFPNL
jgi:hypothetical protein